jgi:hypothetical protein
VDLIVDLYLIHFPPMKGHRLETTVGHLDCIAPIAKLLVLVSFTVVNLGSKSLKIGAEVNAAFNVMKAISVASDYSNFFPLNSSLVKSVNGFTIFEKFSMNRQ